MKQIQNRPKTANEQAPKRPPQVHRGGRPKIKHGGFSMMTYRGELPAHRRHIARYIQEIRDGLIKDLGGEAAMTTGQRILVDRITQGLAIVRLIEEHVRELGLLDHPEGFLHPSLSMHYLRWQSNIHRDLALLGIERREQDAGPTWAEVVAEVKAERQAQDAERALPEHASGTTYPPEITPTEADPAVYQGKRPSESEDDALVEALDKDKNSQHGT